MIDWTVRMERALAMLGTRLDAPPSLQEMAAAASVSPFHFHRIWRAMTGETLGHTVERLRIAVAQQRLAAGGTSITQVAMDGGFGTSQSFARSFRRVAGTTPTGFLASGSTAMGTAAQQTAEVRVEIRAERQLVALRQEGGAYRELNALFWAVWNWAEGKDLLDQLQGIYGIPLDDPISVAEEQLRYDACLAIDEPGTPPPPLRALTLAEGAYAVLRHVGSYDDLEHTNQRIIEWLLASGREPADMPLFHHFLDDPEQVPEEALRTDVLLRLSPAPPAA